MEQKLVLLQLTDMLYEPPFFPTSGWSLAASIATSNPKRNHWWMILRITSDILVDMSNPRGFAHPDDQFAHSIVLLRIRCFRSHLVVKWQRNS